MKLIAYEGCRGNNILEALEGGGFAYRDNFGNCGLIYSNGFTNVLYDSKKKEILFVWKLKNDFCSEKKSGLETELCIPICRKTEVKSHL